MPRVPRPRSAWRSPLARFRPRRRQRCHTAGEAIGGGPKILGRVLGAIAELEADPRIEIGGTRDLTDVTEAPVPKAADLQAISCSGSDTSTRVSKKLSACRAG